MPSSWGVFGVALMKRQRLWSLFFSRLSIMPRTCGKVVSWHHRCDGPASDAISCTPVRCCHGRVPFQGQRTLREMRTLLHWQQLATEPHSLHCHWVPHSWTNERATAAVHLVHERKSWLTDYNAIHDSMACSLPPSPRQTIPSLLLHSLRGIC
jgi:hypothetical protein